jgi:hypothetical protein
MRKVNSVLLLIVLCALTAVAAKKESGNTTLKDLQPAGLTSKENKNQQFDFSFEASGKHYVCRTSHKTSIKATDFVVGTDLKYEVDGDKGKLKNSSGKEVKCTVVRAESLPTPQR